MPSLKSALRAPLVLAIAAMLLSACGVNTIPTLDEQVKAQWGEVQNQYQRRADLIPNLVATVQGYAAQERDVLVAVTQARASATQPQFDASTITDPAKFQQFQQAQDQLSGVLGRLMMIQERYPDLKSNQNFLALQSQLEGTENRITVARRDYNEAARRYNTEIRTFPGALWAGTVHRWAKPAQMFTAQAGAQNAPTVTFERPTAPTVNGATPGAGPAPMPTPSTTTTVPATNTVQ